MQVWVRGDFQRMFFGNDGGKTKKKPDLFIFIKCWRLTAAALAIKRYRLEQTLQWIQLTDDVTANDGGGEDRRVWGEVSKYTVGVTHVSVYVCERDSCWHTQLVITAWHTYCALVIQTWIYELRVQSIHKHTHTQARLYMQHTSHLLYVFLALALTSKCGISVKINYF